MLKKILCIVLVLVIVGSAVGFIVYDNVGKVYDYEGKDMSKYIGMTLTPDQIKNMDLTAKLAELEAVWREVKADDKEIGYKIAAAIAGVKSTEKDTLEGGTLANYDELTILYYVTLEDGTIVSNPTLMNMDATTKPTIQIGEDPVDESTPQYPELSGMISSALIGKEYQIFNVIRSGKVEETDTIWVEYTVTLNDETSSAKTYKYQMTTLAGLDTLKAGDKTLAGLTAAFTAKQNEQINALEGNKSKVPEVIGKKFEGLTVTEEGVKVDLKVLYASRAIATEGDIMDNDTVYFTYKKKGDSTSTQLVATKNADGQAAMLEAFKADTFYTQLMALKLDDADNKEIKVTITKDDNTTEEITYVVSIDYAIPADPTAEREGVIKANPVVGGAGIEATYPETSVEVTYDATGNQVKENEKTVDLKGKKVLVYVYVVGGTHFNYGTFESIYEDLAFTSTGDEATDAYLKAVSEHKAAEKALADEQAKESPDQTKVTELTTKRDTAKTALDTATKEYNKAKGVDENTTRNADEDIKAEYEEDQRKAVQVEVNNERAYGVASVVWEALLAQVKSGSVKYPSKAVRLAKKGILDNYKSTYYTNRDKDGYKEYKTFNAYLANKVYTGQDKDAAIRAEAEQEVLETMLVHYLADVYGIALGEEDTTGIDSLKSFYEAYGIEQPSGYWEAARTALIFDKVMRKIAEDREPHLNNDDLT